MSVDVLLSFLVSNSIRFVLDIHVKRLASAMLWPLVYFLGLPRDNIDLWSLNDHRDTFD